VTHRPDPELYVPTVLRLYLELPDTPQRARCHDRRLAQELLDRDVPLALVEAALLLATARRNARSPTALPLGTIRSLSYFLPIIEELRQRPPTDGYLDYLRAGRTQDTRPGTPTGNRPENNVSL